MISKIAIVVDHYNLEHLLKMVDYYKNNSLYSQAKIVFFVHEALADDLFVNAMIQEKVYCNEIDVFHKISEALKDEEYAAFTFETFVFNDFKLPETCCYIKKDFVSYGAFVGSKDFWNRTNKIIKNISSTFESIRKFNSSYLFLKIVDIFYKDAIDLTENINSKTENNLVIVNN